MTPWIADSESVEKGGNKLGGVGGQNVNLWYIKWSNCGNDVMQPYLNIGNVRLKLYWTLYYIVPSVQYELVYSAWLYMTILRDEWCASQLPSIQLDS